MVSERQFIVDDQGRPKAVVLSIEEYRRLLERLGDAEDLALIEERRSEPDMFVSSVDELNALLAGD
ncbi:MAG: type II toxin-antitoxin system Phd/YefM family antitoxin [Lysobacterales bacterium]|nr:MAG: type II toxin-antitoxin system Phd/YefM family antitoxin [Xanthomonadales bacterium]